MAPPTTFDRIDGRTVLAGNHVSGGTLNITVHEPPSIPQRVEPFSTVPFIPDGDFVERPDVTAWLDTTLAQPGSRAALVGLGGIGKSQIAIDYAHRTRQQSPSTYVLWVHADTQARFEEAYRVIADRLQLPRRHDPEVDALQLVHDWLSNDENGRWLMILDNADNVEVFFPGIRDRPRAIVSKQRLLASFLPQTENGRILVTSRSRDAAERLVGNWGVFFMQRMDKNQATQLLERKLRDKYDEETVGPLALALEYIPLAITQSAAYIIRRWPRMSCSRYLEHFRKNERNRESLLYRDLGDRRRDATAANSVIVTWQITFEQIQKERRSAADLLSFMSLFDPQQIPEWVLQNHYQRVRRIGTDWDDGKENDEDSDDDHDDDNLDDDLELLRDYSLVAVTMQPEIYEMHPLMQFCARAWLSSVGDMARWRRTFLHTMSENYPPGRYENWSKCQQLEPHIAQLIEAQPGSAEETIQWARLLTNAGHYRWKIGGYDKAEALLRKAVEVREALLDENHSDTLMSVTKLLVILTEQGKYEEAEAMHRRALVGCEKVLGKDHLDTLASVHNLAILQSKQGKYEEAETMHRRALDGREKVLGKDHPDTLASVHTLATLQYKQGKYEEAETMYRRALDGREKVLGKDHPKTLASVYNLATLQYKQGKYEEAETMYRRALDGHEKVLGKDHPDTLASVYGLAFTYHVQNRLDEAGEHWVKALRGFQKVLGPTHPNTLACEYNYALLQK